MPRQTNKKPILPYDCNGSKGGSNPPSLGSNPSGVTITNNIINTMELKFKRLEDEAVLPIRSTEGAAGIDLTCIKIDTALNEANQLMLVYHTGLAVEIPAGYVGLLIPRSSIWKKSLWLTDNVGVIDARILIRY